MKNIIIEGIPDYYYVDEFGTIFSFYRGVKSIRKIEVSHDGYERITLSCGKKGQMKKFFVHRIVAMFYLENPDNLPIVNHKDGDKTNNHYTNLEWTTVLGNTQHAYANNLITAVSGDKHYQSYISNETVIKIYEDYLYNGLRNCEAVNKYNISRQVASSIRLKKSYRSILKDYPSIE